MRVKQTARKSTGTRSSQNSLATDDPIRTRMQVLLQTKRKSSTPLNDRRVPVQGSGLGKGKKISFVKPQGGTVKVKPRTKNGVGVLREIKALQNKYDLLIPRAPFHRLIREITQGLTRERAADEGGPELEFRFQAAAVEALQEATEHYLTRMFEDSYLCTIHAKRVTLFVQDIQLCRRIQEGRR